MTLTIEVHQRDQPPRLQIERSLCGIVWEPVFSPGYDVNVALRVLHRMREVAARNPLGPKLRLVRTRTEILDYNPITDDLEVLCEALVATNGL